ncbi:hypothetical protein CAOG_06123 [Capsaspora owczarzaki ATCC 30864]|uniref:Ca3427-like PBP 2 domain-containing protein n=1 Tax=Capsaspora owczarzaki (strain ATCC 30864) TaxID=595528 RepID=A0A0D2X4A1_CAPO3|nr:hypothetical protein CAOG_06123 [Capsaspora owczarzaki ATCC 30864]KJE95699.1 hypothetical protein CAOG_006123 [Capsaspora owczarzaki ATCC 30864]|eukprot:XP_004345713.1 hypothetical protein CAOG_06123 [Capsaspora owczarzaki ATCC 30864]
MSSSHFVVGGVPEHFNAPFHLGMKDGTFARHGVTLDFVDCLGGTGEMTTKLNNGELDVAVALTEGLIAAIAKGEARFKLAAEYCRSPLIWAVSTGANSEVKSVADLDGKTFGISRFGSGSHIMAIVLAKNNGFVQDNHWRVLRNFQGLRDGVNTSEADAFLWEKFTTKPFHDTREVVKVGEIVTPWPAFMVAVSDAALQREGATEKLAALFRGIQESCANFARNDDGASVQYVADKYGNTLDDAAKWFSAVEFSQDGALSSAVLTNVVSILKEADVLTADIHAPPQALVAPALARII